MSSILMLATCGMLAAMDTPIATIIFDRKGGDYSDIPSMLGPHWLHLSIYEGLRIGLNGPEGMPPNAWINTISSLFCARAGLISSSVTFANIIRWTLAQMNPAPCEELLWPDLNLILEIAKSRYGGLFASKTDYLRSLIQVLEGIVQASGDLFRTFGGLDMERDVISKGKSVVIEMPNLYPAWLRQFLVDMIISLVLLGRIHRHHRTNTTEVLFIIDEADPDVSRKSEACFPDGLSTTSQLLKTGREFGLSSCVSVSLLGQVSRFVLGNVQYHLIFNMSDQECVVEAQRTLLLPAGGGLMLPGLNPGECLFRESQGPWPHAILCEVDDVPPSRGV